MNGEFPRLQNTLLQRWLHQAPAPHNTRGSCWLGTAQQFYHDMRGEGGSEVTSKWKHTYTKPRPDHYLTDAPIHMTSAVAAYWGSSAWHSSRSVSRMPGRVLKMPAPHKTCGSCWLRTTQQFSQDMRGKGRSWVWCVCALCFNLPFENSELNFSNA